MGVLNVKGDTKKVYVAMCCVLTGLSIGVLPVHAKSVVAYKPGISLVPEVLLADGQTPRTYNTTSGLSIWTNTLPVVQGDKVKLNVFAATGGAELKEIIVRLDNSKIADITTGPWKTTLDTAKLSAGYHMVEAWAQSTGDHPQSTTQTLTFYVSQQLEARYIPQPMGTTPPVQRVAGMQEVHTDGTTSTEPLPEATPEVAPTLDFLKDKTPDSNAQVALYARSSTGIEGDTNRGTMVTGATVTLNEPTLMTVAPTPGSTATQFAYAIVRDGQLVYSSPSATAVQLYQIRVQKRNEAGIGLRPGTVSLWVWGIDKAGQPSEPVKTTLNIP